MKLSNSGSRGVYWRATARGSQVLHSPSRQRVRGEWWIRWMCSYGHLHREQVGPKSLAQRESEKRRSEKFCPRVQVRLHRPLLADVIKGHLTRRHGQKKSYRDDIRFGRNWTERFGKLALQDITAAMLEHVRVERLHAVEPGTVNREFGFLKHLYNMAIRDEKIMITAVGKLRNLQEPSGRVRYLSPEEEARLMAGTSKAEWDRIELALHTGLRKGEFLALEWTHVDFKTGLLTIPRTKNGSTRHIPMTSVVRDILHRLPRPLHNSLVFPNSAGKPDYRWVEKAFPSIMQATHIDDFHFHDLRHTFASRLAMAGVDLLAIMQLGGWKSLAMVQRYAHLSPDHLQASVECLVTRQIPKEATPVAQGQ